jgi:phospholipid/cholesterol/gamma-HCH transport system substrate-binding protein
MISGSRLVRLAVALVAVAVVVGVGPQLLADDVIELTATYEEVGDLVERGHVRFGDVPVGTVAGIRLNEAHEAEVTLHLDADARLPERAVAVLRMTSVLGERYVDLVPDPDEGAAVVEGAELPSHFEKDIELVVESGSDLLGALSVGHVARTIEVGHRTLDGRGERLGQLLDELGDYAGHLEREREELAAFIDAAERLGATAAPEAELHAAALEDLADLTEVLGEEEERLIGALDELAGTADIGARIVADNRESLDALLRRVGRLSAEALRIDQALENMLLWLPRHNLAVPGGVISEHVQVINDFTLCGVNDEPDNPANTCDPPNPGEANDPAPGFRITECMLYNVNCDGFPEGVSPYRGEVEEQRTTPEERQRKVEQAEGTADHERRPREPAPRSLP